MATLAWIMTDAQIHSVYLSMILGTQTGTMLPFSSIRWCLQCNRYVDQKYSLKVGHHGARDSVFTSLHK